MFWKKKETTINISTPDNNSNNKWDNSINESFEAEISEINLSDDLNNFDKEKKSVFSLFSRKNKTENSFKEDTTSIEEVSNNNIFDELAWEIDFWDDVNIENKKIKKDKLHYIKLVWNIIWNTNIFIFIILIFLYIYLYIQNNTDLYNKTYLNPICPVILWDNIAIWDSNCSSIRSLLEVKEKEIFELKDKQYKELISLVPDIYKVDNFLFSKDIKFLLSQTESKLKVLDMIEEFDDLLKKFNWVDKGQIKCSSLDITKDSIFNISCDLFSSDWNNEVFWYDWTSRSYIEWTSITLASSFLNYLEKESDNFILLNKQKGFTKESIDSFWYYTQKTTVNLELKYKKDLVDNF